MALESSPNDADGMANSVDPAVWSGSALFAQAYLSENLGSLRYYHTRKKRFNNTSEEWGLDGEGGGLIISWC